MKTRLLLTGLVTLLSLQLMAQTLSPEQLRADFNRFRTALYEVHPQMYRYTPKQTFDSLFTTIEGKLNQSMTQHEFYVTMVPVLVALRDGHIKWIVSGRDEHYPFFSDKMFPLQLYFQGEKAWVLANYGNVGVPAGAEVLSINGQPLAAILQKLLPNMTFADGYTLNGKYDDLNRYFSGFYATFIGAPDAFEVVYRTGNEEKTVTLPAVTEKQIKAYAEAHKPAPQKPCRLTFIDNGKTAVMTVERFYIDKKEQDYKGFLKEAFRDIKQKGAQKLILDLRNNEGGEESYGVLLYSYLAHQPFRYYDHIIVRQKKDYSFPAWTPKLYEKFKWLVVKKRGDGYVFTKQRGLKTEKPNRDAFGGELYILINGASFSVTTEFAARVHADKRAVFIGQETGGAYESNSSGIFAITQLPNSKIDLGIPMFGFHMANLPANLKKGQGIIPDHTVMPTINDLLTGNDRVLNYTLQLINPKTSAVPSAKVTATK